MAIGEYSNLVRDARKTRMRYRNRYRRALRKILMPIMPW